MGCRARGEGLRCDGRGPVLDDVEYDDSESPAIGLVPADVQWTEVQDHIKIAHNPLLVPPTGGRAQYAGVYWAGTAMIVAENLGSDQEQALCDFREFLRDHGET